VELKCVIKTDLNNPDLGDLYLGDDGDAVLIPDSELGAQVAQRLTVRFNFFLGEWFLDLNEGTPWFQRIMVKAPSDKVIRAVLTNVILGCEGIATLDQLSYSIGRDRLLSVTFKATLTDGTVFSSTQYAAFTVDLSVIEG
jgi:hypothetical protein